MRKLKPQPTIYGDTVIRPDADKRSIALRQKNLSLQFRGAIVEAAQKHGLNYQLATEFSTTLEPGNSKQSPFIRVGYHTHPTEGKDAFMTALFDTLSAYRAANPSPITLTEEISNDHCTIVLRGSNQPGATFDQLFKQWQEAVFEPLGITQEFDYSPHTQFTHRCLSGVSLPKPETQIAALNALPVGALRPRHYLHVLDGGRTTAYETPQATPLSRR